MSGRSADCHPRGWTRSASSARCPVRAGMSDQKQTRQDPTVAHGSTSPTRKGVAVARIPATRRPSPRMGENPDQVRRPTSPTPVPRQVALVTGGDSGIGRAVALAFAREGADAPSSPTSTRRGRRRAGDRADRRGGRSRRAVLVPTDLVRRSACQALVDRAVAELGRIDVLVNNAAYQMAQPGGIADITTEQLDRLMRTNRLRDVLAVPDGAAPHEARREHHQHLVGAVVLALAGAARLRHATTTATPRPPSSNFTRGLAQSVAEQGHPGQRARRPARSGPRSSRRRCRRWRR